MDAGFWTWQVCVFGIYLGVFEALRFHAGRAYAVCLSFSARPLAHALAAVGADGLHVLGVLGVLLFPIRPLRRFNAVIPTVLNILVLRGLFKFLGGKPAFPAFICIPSRIYCIGDLLYLAHAHLAIVLSFDRCFKPHD